MKTFETTIGGKRIARGLIALLAVTIPFTAATAAVSMSTGKQKPAVKAAPKAPAAAKPKGKPAIKTMDIENCPVNGYYSGNWVDAPDYPWVFCGNKPMRVAREPDTGWWTFQGADNVPSANLPKQGDFSLAGYWTQDWAFEVLRVDGFNPNGTVRFKDQHGFGIGGPAWAAKDRRYFAVNHPSFLNAPGEWWLDAKAKKIHYIPFNDDPIRVCWNHTPALGIYGRHNETIRGKTIAFSDVNGIEIRESSGITIADCVIECIGGNGIDISSDCSDIVITNCVIRNVGRYGMIVNGPNCRILDCDIHDFALAQRTYAPGIYLSGESSVIRGCKIHSAPHSAIIYYGKNHLIADNEIYDVILETGDSGAIYTGRDLSSNANRVVHNYIHDLAETVKGEKADEVFTMGIYIDDCDSSETIMDNRIVGTGCAITLGGGRDLVVKGNDIRQCRKGIHLDDRGIHWQSDWLQGKMPFFPVHNDLSGNKFTGCGQNFEIYFQPEIWKEKGDAKIQAEYERYMKLQSAK